MSVARWALAAVLLILLVLGIPIALVSIADWDPAGIALGLVLSVGGAAGLLALGPPAQAARAPGPLGALGTLGTEEHEFVAELRRMLDHVAPRRLDDARTVLAEGTRELVLAHDRRPDWDIHVAVDAGAITVGTAGAHEHFYEEMHDDPVDFVAELLRGEIEVRRHYRGRHLVKIEHGRTQSGRFEPFVSTIPMSRGLLMPWAGKRVEAERPDFEAVR